MASKITVLVAKRQEEGRINCRKFHKMEV